MVENVNSNLRGEGMFLFMIRVQGKPSSRESRVAQYNWLGSEKFALNGGVAMCVHLGNGGHYRPALGSIVSLEVNISDEDV